MVTLSQKVPKKSPKKTFKKKFKKQLYIHCIVCIVLYMQDLYMYRGQHIINSRGTTDANKMTLKADALQKYGKAAVTEMVCMYVSLSFF